MKCEQVVGFTCDSEGEINGEVECTGTAAVRVEGCPTCEPCRVRILKAEPDFTVEAL